MSDKLLARASRGAERRKAIESQPLQRDVQPEVTDKWLPLIGLPPHTITHIGGALREQALLHLQHTVGNHAIQRTIDRLRSTSIATDDLAQRIRAASISGSPLDAAVRDRLEAGLNADLSSVQIHTDHEADRLSRSVHALAFTTGQHIFFKRGEYQPETIEGLHLIAHETMHTLQQANWAVTGTPVSGELSISEPSDDFERAAEQVANTIVSTAPRTVSRNRLAQTHPVNVSSLIPSTSWIQRAPEEEQGEGAVESEGSALEEVLSGAIDDFVETLAEGYVPYYAYVSVAAKLGEAFGEGMSNKIQQIYQSEKEFYSNISFASGIYEDKPGQRALAREALGYQARALDNLKKAIRAGLVNVIEKAVNLAVDMLRDWVVVSAIKKPVEKIGDRIGDFVEDNLPKVFKPGTKKTIGEFANDMSVRIVNAFATSTARYASKAHKTGDAKEMKLSNLWQDVYEKMHAGLARQREALGKTEAEKRQEEDAHAKYWEFRAAFDELVDEKEKDGDKTKMAELATKAIDALAALELKILGPVDLESDIKTLRIFRDALSD